MCKMAVVLYFDHSQGQTTGNTVVVAEKIAALTESQLVPLKAEKSYPEDYQTLLQVTKAEATNQARPEIIPLALDWSKANTLFLGYPIWWGRFPRAVATFLENTDLSGKTIYPFCTHEGSRLGQSVTELQQLCPQSTIQTGLPVRGSKVQQSDQAIKNWLAQMTVN